MPPTVECERGSVTWRLKATVHRPGTFTPKLSASREVILVASPSEDHSEDADGHFIERFWEDKMQYVLSVSGRVFPIGGVIPLTLSFLPMTKVKIFKISVHLEGNVIHPPSMVTSTHDHRASGLLLHFLLNGMPQGA
jgi:hypothetical protein